MNDNERLGREVQEILHDAGKISHKIAQELAYKEYDKFKKKHITYFH